jgi:hypothetical protein
MIFFLVNLVNKVNPLVCQHFYVNHRKVRKMSDKTFEAKVSEELYVTKRKQEFVWFAYNLLKLKYTLRMKHIMETRRIAK